MVDDGDARPPSFRERVELELRSQKDGSLEKFHRIVRQGIDAEMLSQSLVLVREFFFFYSLAVLFRNKVPVGSRDHDWRAAASVATKARAIADEMERLNRSPFNPAYSLIEMGRASDVADIIGAPATVRRWVEALDQSIRRGKIGSVTRAQRDLGQHEEALIAAVERETGKLRLVTLGAILISLCRERGSTLGVAAGPASVESWFEPEALAVRHGRRSAASRPKR